MLLVHINYTWKNESQLLLNKVFFEIPYKLTASGFVSDFMCNILSDLCTNVYKNVINSTRAWLSAENSDYDNTMQKYNVKLH